jgi:tetratricopeptide (TPR) repeat protein
VGTARFTANIRVVDSETGKVLLSKQLQREDVARTSADGKQPAPIDADVLKDSVTQQAADDFVAAIAPHEVSESVVLVEDGDLPQLKQGNAYVQRGDHAGSLEYYRAAVQKAETSGDMDPEIKGKAHYALGLALALGGDYESGLVELGKAYDLNPEDAWLDLQIRVKQWKADREKALEQVALNDEAPAEVAQQQTPSPDMAGAEEIPVDAERGTEAPADAEGMEGAEETSPEHSPANQ